MALHSLRQQRETGCIDYEILAFDEAEPPQFIEQREIMRCIARARKQAAEAINASGLLSARHERPRDGRAAEQRDELAPFHVGHGEGGKVSLSAIMPLLPTAGLKQQPQLPFSKIGGHAEDEECRCTCSLDPRCGQEGLICEDEKQVAQAGREDAKPGGVKEPKWR